MKRVGKQRVQSRFPWPLAAFAVAVVVAAALVGVAVAEPIPLARVGYIAGAVMALVIAVTCLFGIGSRNREEPARQFLIVVFVEFASILALLLAWFLR